MHEEKDKNKHLNQQRALELNAYVAGAGAFGVFFRWMQRQLAFEDGLSKGSFWNFMVPLSILIVGYVFLRFVDRFKNQRYSLPDEFEGALANPGKLYSIARWTAGLLMCVGGLAILATCETDKNAVMLRVLAVLAILTGLSFPVLLSAPNRERPWLKPKVLCLFSFLPILLFAVWLILSYKENAINSVVWDFAVEIVTLCVAMLSFFHVAGFAYGQPNTWRAMFFAMFGAFLCIMSLADSRNVGQQLILLSAALMLIYYNWIMAANLRSKTAEEKEDPDDGFERLR